jgi:hypothetical protein
MHEDVLFTFLVLGQYLVRTRTTHDPKEDHDSGISGIH